MEQRRLFYFILLNIDNSTSARFEKLDLSQFQLYIETQTMTQYFVCRNCKKTILVISDEGKFIFFKHMLRIYNGLRELIRTNVYDLHL